MSITYYVSSPYVCPDYLYRIATVTRQCIIVQHQTRCPAVRYALLYQSSIYYEVRHSIYLNLLTTEEILLSNYHIAPTSRRVLMPSLSIVEASSSIKRAEAGGQLTVHVRTVSSTSSPPRPPPPSPSSCSPPPLEFLSVKTALSTPSRLYLHSVMC